MPQIYAYPNLGRHGLGNLLLPWARAEIFAHRHRVPVIAPQWTRPRLGPILRGEKDKRFYTGLFDNRSYVRGLKRLTLLMRADRIGENEFGEQIFASETKKPALVVFEGLANYFEPLLPHRDYLRRRIDEILSPHSRAGVATLDNRFVIGAHVRRGDKPPTLKMGDRLGAGLPCTPTEWFLITIQNIRRVLGFDASVRVFSDGTDDQIAPILALPNVHRAPENSSIVDILGMAKSKILLTTVKSSFSMWSSFLGEMPTLWYTDQLVRLNPDKPGYDAETDLQGNLPPPFIDALRGLQLKRS